MQATTHELLNGEPVEGATYFHRLKPLLAPLHNAGCARDKAGNRALHFDQYCSLIFLSLFNPLVRSLRGLSQASKLNRVQKDLGEKRGRESLLSGIL